MKRFGLKLIQQLKKYLEKRREDNVAKRIEHLTLKIHSEMPELSGLDLSEKVKIYHEIKGINSQRISNCVMALLTIAIIILTTLQFVIQKNQTELIAKQTELLEKSTPPFEPELRIWSEYSPLELSMQSLLNKNGQRERVKICAKNIGQTNTGHIYYHWQNNWTHNYNGINIHPGIESGDTNCDWLELTAQDCFGDPDGCMEENVPLGWVDLNLSIQCDYCIPKEAIKTLKTCIWKETSATCK